MEDLACNAYKSAQPTGVTLIERDRHFIIRGLGFALGVASVFLLAACPSDEIDWEAGDRETFDRQTAQYQRQLDSADEIEKQVKRQMERYEESLDRVQRLDEKAAALQLRYDQILERWEMQADSMDRIIDKMQTQIE